MRMQSYEALETRFFSNLAGNRFRAYRTDPAGFTRDVLGITLWERQSEGVDAVREHDRIAERSGHGIGKTLQVSAIALWAVYALRWLVLSTAPTFRQVESVLWRQIHKLFYGARVTLPGAMLKTQLSAGEAMAMGLSTNEPARFQGYHDAEGILVIEDEAPGVPPTIHEAIEGVLSGGGKWIKIGNPTSPSGPFFDCFRSPGWHTLHVSSLEHPNVVQDKMVIPGAVTRQWCEDRRREWGEDSPLYQARVLGEFPDEGEDTLIRLSWAEAAFDGGDPVRDMRSDSADSNHRVERDKILTCDVARYGQDETVIGVRCGQHYTELVRYTGKDLMHTVGQIKRYVKELSPSSVVVDDDGLGGGVTDRLHEQGVHVTAFRGGERPMTDEFINRRAEAWWALREALREGDLAIETRDPDGLKYQLTAPRYGFDSRGRIKLESKDDMKKRGVRSPDRADALAMSYGPRVAPIWEM